MRINSDQLYTLTRIHEILIEKNGYCLLGTIADSIGTNPFATKRLLSQLEKIKAIRGIRFAGNAFSYELLISQPLSANRLVEDYGFSLIIPGMEDVEMIRKAEQVEELRTQNELLKKQIAKLDRDFDCIAKHGKPLDKILEDAQIDHGD